MAQLAPRPTSPDDSAESHLRCANARNDFLEEVFGTIEMLVLTLDRAKLLECLCDNPNHALADRALLHIFNVVEQGRERLRASRIASADRTGVA